MPERPPNKPRPKAEISYSAKPEVKKEEPLSAKEIAAFDEDSSLDQMTERLVKTVEIDQQLPGAIEKLKTGAAQRKNEAITREQTREQIAALRRRAFHSMDRNERPGDLRAQADKLEAQLLGKVEPPSDETPDSDEELVHSSVEDTRNTVHEWKGALRETVEEIKKLEDLGIVEAFAKGSGVKPESSTDVSILRDQGIEEAFVKGSEPEASVPHEAPVAPDASEKIALPEIAAAREGLIRETRAIRGAAAAEKLDKQFKKNGIRTTNEFFLKSTEKHRNALAAEAAYFKALDTYDRRKRNSWELLKGNFVDTKKKLPPQVQKLKDAWQQTRKEEVMFMRRSLEERYSKRHTDKDGKNKGPVSVTELDESGKKIVRKNGPYLRDKKSVLERYDRRYGKAITQNATLEAKRAEQQVRIEAFDKRKKSGIEKLMERYSKLPPAVRIGTTYALMTGGAMIATGGAFGLVPLVLGGGTALLRWRAAVNKPGARKNIYTTISRLTSVGGILGFLGSNAVRAAHRELETEIKAAQTLEKQSGLGLQDVLNDKYFDQLGTDWEKAMSTNETIERQAKLAGVGASIFGGLVVGAGLHEAFSSHAVVPVEHTTGTHVEHGGTVHHSEMKHITRDEMLKFVHHPGSVPAGGHESANVHDELSVDHAHINDGDKLIGHFAQKLEHDGIAKVGAHNNPPAIQKLFDELHTKDGASLLKGEDHASHDLGLEHKGLSTILQPGDKILFDHGRILLDRPGHPELHNTVLIDEKGTIHQLDPKVWHHAGTHHHVAHEAAAQPHKGSETAPGTGTSQQAAAEAAATPQTDTSSAASASSPATATTAPAAIPAAQHPEASPEHPWKTTDQLNSDELAHIRAEHAHVASQQPEVVAQPAHSETPPTQGQPSAEAAPPAHTESTATSPEQPAAAPDTFENAPPLINDLVHSDSWASMKDSHAFDVIEHSSLDTDAAIRTHQELLSIIRESGTGPSADESLQSFIGRASHEIQEHIDVGGNAADIHVGIYQTADNHLIAHGGDLNARLLLAREFVTHQNTPTEVTVENPGGNTPLIVVSQDSLATDAYPRSTIKVPASFSEDQLVF